MATKKQTVTKKRSATATQITNQRHNKPSDGKREVWAILLFALAIFLVFLIFVKGQNIWLDLHNFVFGLNGIGAYLLPVFVGAIAVIIGLDKLRDSAAVRVAECAGVFWVFLAAVDIIITKADVFETYGEHLKNAYNLGTGIKGGGFFGALIGNAIFKAFGKVGATVTIFLILFVMLMLLTGTTLIRFLQTVAKPVKHIEKQAERNYANAQQRRAEQEDPSKWDIPIEEEQRPARTAKKAEVGTQATFEDISSTTPDTSAKEAAERAVQAAEKTAPQPMSEAEKAAFAEKFGQEIIANAENEEKTYELPPLSLLKSGKSGGIAAGKAELQQTAESLVNVLRSFGVETRVLDISRGPTVTRYELQPSAGVKISKITGLADDIALNLATAGVRIEAPIPNKAAVGIEVPNKTNGMVTVREILESEEFVNAKSKLSVVMGRDIAGKAVVTDIAKMPHGLIAGSTGSGKSVCINSIIMSLLYRATPDEVKLLMIDPKVVELNVYNGIPHLLAPVVTDPRKASGALGWAVQEMEKRYRLFAENDVRNLEGYNHLAELSDDMVKMPQIVIIIDELADLMMTCPGDVEDSICRIAQKARAAGMHLIVATQRPSVDVVTGLIKANVPTRIAFMVSSQTDSRTILDMGGAEKLLGKGDMLFCPVGANKPTRIQGCFVSDGEVENVVEYIKKHCDGEHQYDSAVCEGIEKITAAQREKGSKTISSGDDDNDPMLDQAIEFCVESGKASTSMLQRHLKLGYARAARIIDQLEAMGVVGPFEGGSRQVLMTKAELEERRAREE